MRRSADTFPSCRPVPSLCLPKVLVSKYSKEALLPAKVASEISPWGGLSCSWWLPHRCFYLNSLEFQLLPLTGFQEAEFWAKAYRLVRILHTLLGFKWGRLNTASAHLHTQGCSIDAGVDTSPSGCSPCEGGDLTNKDSEAETPLKPACEALAGVPGPLPKPCLPARQDFPAV